MTKDELRSILNQPYRFENWKNVVDFVFPNVSYLQRPLVIPPDEDKVESFRQVGSVRLADGKNLALFEVHVKPNVNIARNRVALRNLVAKYIDQERNHGVLAIYEKGTEEYRFTFTAKDTDYDEEKGDFVQKETETKRFTYVLGTNESCRTARDRFWDLSLQKEKATIKDVENAFSVEKLSKEFFNKYKEHYTAFVNYLTNSNFKISAFNADEKAIRDFVKKMLGRIVFLHFVQKKGWLGASNAEYKDGDKHFMYHLWQKLGKNEAFYQLALVPLFFDALNQNHRKDDSFLFYNDWNTRIPYLGGGLFEKDRNEPIHLTFPTMLFDGLFEFFNEYNFTIDENDPHENEVGIDPEMLGHIFENLLEDNKDKGAFYTPKPIVKYMCQESLIQYLLTSFEKEGIASNETEKKDFEEKLGILVKRYEAHEVIEYDRILAKALYNVKICDPAIGSGAFPMGILNEMVMLINVLHNVSPDVVEDIWDMDNWQPATVKKHIIQNSIYGVDIEKGAVDIARLRFWLSLIIDEEKPCNLPSLDYKIVVGNSLISKFEDEVIDIDWEVKEEDIQGNLFGDENEKKRQKLLNNISQKQIAFYAAENHQKENLELEIRNLKIDLLINQLQLQIKKKGLEKVQELAKGNVLKNQTEQYLKTQGWKQTITELENLKKHPEKPFLHFDWKLDFPEVLNPLIAEENGGFDILIANPPYGSLLANGDKEYITDNFVVTQGPYEIYKFFIEKGLNLLKNNSHLCYITPDTWINLSYFKNLRKLIFIENQLISCTKSLYNVFDEATVDVNIFLIKKNNIPNKIKIIDEKFRHIGETVIFDMEEFNLILKTRPILIEKIEKNCKRLTEFVFIWRGMSAYGAKTPGKPYNSTIKVTEFHRPLLNGGDIGKYFIKWNNEFIKFGEWLHRPRPSYIYDRPHILIQRIRNPKLKNRIVGTIDNESFISSDGLSNLILKDETDDKVTLQTILALLNSKVINYWFSFYFFDVNIKPEQLRQIPIKISHSDEISKLVERILLIKKEDIHACSRLYEDIIDLMVYKLYELTYDEVLVVDPEFGMSHEEYETFRNEEQTQEKELQTTTNITN